MIGTETMQLLVRKGIEDNPCVLCQFYEDGKRIKLACHPCKDCHYSGLETGMADYFQRPKKEVKQ